MVLAGLFAAGGLAVTDTETGPVSAPRPVRAVESPVNAKVDDDLLNDRTPAPKESYTRELRRPGRGEKAGERTKGRSKALGKAERKQSSRRVHVLFSENYRQIWRLLRRFGVPEANADDAAQKVFLILAERIDDVKFGSERAFLYGTAFRVATGLRRVSHRERPTDLADEQKSSMPRPDELTDRKRARDLLDRLLAQLDDDLRTAFILYELEGFTAPEIADLVEVPLGTAASRLRRARERFRRLVAEFSTNQGVGP